MPSAKLVITAVIVEGSSQAEVARSYGVSEGWVSRLVARYRGEGESAFEPRSRRPKTSPTATPTATIELVARLRKELTEQGLDAGADTIGWQPAAPPPDHRVTGHDQPDPGPLRCRGPAAG